MQHRSLLEVRRGVDAPARRRRTAVPARPRAAGLRAASPAAHGSDAPRTHGVRATLLLADSAQVADGKLYILGGGWNITGPTPVPLALAILVEIPWDRTNERHRLRLELLDADGQPVTVPQPDGTEVPLVVEGEFEVGRPTGLRPGAPINFPFAVNL